MSGGPTYGQANDALAEVAGILEQLVSGVDIPLYDSVGQPAGHRQTPGMGELFRLDVMSRRDGYRRQTRPGTTPASIVDEHDVPMPPVNDPTGEAATSNVSDVDHHLRAVAGRIVRGLSEFRAARDALVKAFPEAAGKSGPGAPGCSSCARHTYEPRIHRDGRCRFCYDFWLRYGFEPPLELLVLHHQGRRITPDVLAQALAEHRRSTRRKRSRRVRVAHH